MKNKHLLLIGITIIMLVTACGNNEESATGNSKVSISRFEKDSNTISQEDEALLISLSEQQEIKEEQEEDDNNRYDSNEHVGELAIRNENNTGESLENNDNTNETEEGTEPSESDTESSETSETSETENDNNVENTDNVSEVENTPDTDLSYVISNNDIIYNDIIYTDLYLNIQQIEQQSQYDIDTLIKFILQSYPSSEQVYTFIQMNNGAEITDGEDYTDILIDEVLSEASDNYNDICNRYNDRATWMLTINKWMGKDKAMLAGCKSFTIIIGTDEDIEVDVSNFE